MRRGRWLEVCWYVAVSALAIVANFVHGAQFYVAPSGSNANPGTALAPWATLQHAADVVQPGDRVTAKPGDYTGFYLDRSGTPASRIEFFAEPGARITQRNATTPDGINLEGASYVTIDGFSVTGMPRAGVRSVGFPSDFAEFVTVRNVHAYDNNTWGIFTGHVDDLLIENNETSGSKVEHGIYVSNSGDRPMLRGNYSWGNHGSGIHMNGDLSQGGDGLISGALITGNRIFGNAASINGGPIGGGSGINMDGVQNSRIENNLVWGNHASGISLYKIDGAAGSSGNVVINNTIHNAADGRWDLNIQSGSTNNTVRNNILVMQQPFRGAIDVSANSLPGFTSDYNALISRLTTNGGDSILSLAQWRTATGQDAHSLVATPDALFVNWPGAGGQWQTGDYHLKPGSPAINAGTSALAPTVDLFGAARIGAVDLGAIGFTSAAADFTGDGSVTGADLTAWRTAFAGHTPGADADHDGDSDGADFFQWQRQLGASSVTATPEPSSAALAVTLAAMLLSSTSRRFI